jgi:hypothetical protein
VINILIAHKPPWGEKTSSMLHFTGTTDLTSALSPGFPEITNRKSRKRQLAPPQVARKRQLAPPLVAQVA